MRYVALILLTFLLILLILDRHAKPPEKKLHPIIEKHQNHGPIAEVPVLYGKSTLFVCRDSVATFYGHRALTEDEQEAYNQHEKPKGE